MENLQSLLDLIGILVKKDKELRILNHENFNVFHLCGVEHYENIHSKIIAGFLAPNGSHGFGNAFLEEFCKKINIDFANFKDSTVRTEYSTETGRFDIIIEKADAAIVIENKIYAGEQRSQLSRYAEWLNRNKEKKYLIFLTLKGAKAHTITEQDKERLSSYCELSYAIEVVGWLEHCIKISAERPYVREALCQYRNLIKELTGTDMDTTLQTEAFEIITKSKSNLVSASFIHNNFANAYETLIASIFQQVCPSGMDAIFCKKSDTRFYGVEYRRKDISNPSYFIRFEFQSWDYKQLFWGLGANDSRYKDAKIMIPAGNLPFPQIGAGESAIWNGYKLNGPNENNWIIHAYPSDDHWWNLDVDAIGDGIEDKFGTIKKKIQSCLDMLDKITKQNQELLDNIGMR